MGDRHLPTNARWMRNFGACQYCGVKPAVAVLMGDRNEEIGRACLKCGQLALAKYRISAAPGCM